MNVVALGLLIAWAFAVQSGQPQVYQGIEQNLPIEVEKQPVPFSFDIGLLPGPAPEESGFPECRRQGK